MLNERTAQSLFYVWQPQCFTPAITRLVQENNIQVILDVSQLTVDQLTSDIQSMDGVELKISLEQFFSPAVTTLLLDDLQTKAIWVEYFQQLSPYSPEAFLQQISDCNTLNCNVITGDLGLIHTCFTQPSQISGLAIKGSESSGFVSSETILTLLSHLETLAANHPSTPAVHVWGGIATPEGACACLASGVSRVVFESLHWLTDKILDPNTSLAKKISNIRIDHTSAMELRPNLQLRVFDKGNSPAVKTIKQVINDADNYLSGTVEKLTTDISSKIILPLQADFDGKQLIPLGPEAAFATAFVKRFGQETATALPHFAKATAQLLTDAHKAIPKMLNSEITKVLGIRYPFIQGAMACISDVPEFALSIAQAGGLPTIAMGIKSIKEIKQDLATLNHTLQGYPYAINVITLPENPYRNEQLAWLEENKPPFVVISAGDPSHAAKLQEQGITVIYVTSDTDLLQLAWNNNISIVICEGQEAGGHVGVHSTLTLAQTVLELRQQNITAEPKQLLVMAGGISDTNSLGRAALLGADGVQMGTLYLSSQEIVSSGALSELYQQTLLKSSFGDTTLTGESVGLRVRAIASPKTAKIRSLENELQQQTNNETAIRHQLEETSIGSLLIAARNRHPKNGELLSEDICYQEGQFMSGAIAGDLKKIFPVAELHQLLVKNEFEAILQSSIAPLLALSNKSEDTQERIAITGMAMVNSLGNSPEEIWQACLAMESGISEIPPDKWDHSTIFKTNSSAPGETYCRVGAFLSLDIARKELGIPPHDFRTMTASTKLTLWLAHRAIHESTLLTSDISRHKIGVLVSQNAGEFGSTTADLTIFTAAKSIADAVRQSCNLSPEESESLEQTIRSGHLEIDDTTLLGRLNCAAAGFICNKYGFTGPSYSVTSACASSLTALYNAVQLMRNGVLDAAIVGGGEELLSQGSFLEFSALGALAGKGYDSEDPAAFSRPFDTERSGMVLGEGGGLLVLERESIAKKRGAPILAFITGVGASNNHLGMVESVAETQKIAISTSFEDAGYGPEQIDMVECHATATHMGDREEVNALKEIFPPNSSVVLASFKSQIGHTLGASGVNSLIRGICAMHAGTFPPTLNYHKPDPDIGLEEAGFRVCKEPEPWPQHLDRARRFEVNAFGFGGANYVIQVENSNSDNTQTSQVLAETTTAAVPSMGVSFFKTQLNQQTFRIGVIDKKNEGSTLEKRVSPYHQDLAKLTFKQKKELKEHGISVAEEAEGLPLALVFAGQGTHYPQMGKELYQTFPVIRHWMDTLAELADFDILHLLFQEDGSQLQKTEWQQPALFLLEYAIYKQLNEFGLQPTAMAGHSMGELTALCVAGCFSYEDGFKIINKRAQCMAKASTMDVDPGTMLAVNAPEDYLSEKIAANDKLFFTNFNSPRQTVIGGATLEIENFKQILDTDGHWNVQLPVSMAFHSPIMKIIREELGDYIGEISMQAPKIPVLSNTTRAPYPDDTDEIKKTIISHLESPVHWQDNVLSLVNDFGCRQFLEIGPQDTLCTLIHECTKNVQCINSCSAENEVLALQQSLSSLFVKGCVTPDTATSISLQEKQRKISREAVLNIIQQEVYSYALHGAEKFLKPSIIEAIQQNIDPNFSEHNLAEYMPDDFTPGLISGTTKASTPNPVPENNAILEQVIQIIMDATGYDRDEIEAEMNVRDDLAIKSSRIPIIVDAAEKTFNISTTLEDFLTVRTVQDLADRVAELMEGDDFQAPAKKVTIDKSISSSTHNTPALVSSSKHGINRLIYQEEKITPAEETSLQIAPDSRILLLSLGNEDNFQNLCESFSDKYHAEIISLQVEKNHQQNGFIDLFNSEKTIQVVERISAEGPLTGIVLFSDSQAEDHLSPQEIISLVTSFFVLFQYLLKSNNREFCIHFHHSNSEKQTDSLLSQSILGLLFTAAKEYKGLCVRSLTIQGHIDLPAILPIAFNLSNPLVDLLIKDQQLYTYKALRKLLSIPEHPTLTLSNDDVIVISGGGRGITSYLARSLAPFGCRLILLGRTSLDPLLSQTDIPADSAKEKQFISSYVEQHYDNLSPREVKAKQKAVQCNIEVLQTLTELKQLGATAQYISCDVTDEEQVNTVMDTIAEEHGKIDGVIHGAGIIKDSYIMIIKPDMLKEVLDVKLFGAINLLQAAEKKGLRFAVTLSSIAAAGGSVGQANYCIANRAMSTYCRIFKESNPAVQTKVFWLPPIEGTGMADTPEIKDILQQNLGNDIFLEVHEVSEIMLRELLCAPPDDCWIVPLRDVPQSEIILSDPIDQSKHWFNMERLPMIDSITHLDLRTKAIHATRTLSSDRDLWLADHTPSKLLRHPIMSAIMAVEAFLETSHILFPHLLMNGLQNITLLQMIECPLDTDTEIHLFCQGEKSSSSQQICNVEIKRPRKSSTDKLETSMDTFFMAQVLASTEPMNLGQQKNSVQSESPLLSQQEIAELYENYSHLKNRYQVLDSIIECQSNNIHGRMFYPEVDDFSEALPSSFHYPHYLLEAMMQITFFFTSIQNNGEPRIMIPAAMDSISFTRNCRAGEELFLNGQLKQEDKTGTIWDVYGVDSNGFIIMEVQGLQMKWVD